MEILLNTFLPIFGWVLFLILLADFISGLGHWFEDVYGNPDWPLLGKYIVLPNMEHHNTPNSFLKATYWYRNGMIILTGIALLATIFLLGKFCWQVAFLIIYLSQVNEVHAISHRRKNKIPAFFRFLQSIGLVQSNLHHGWHHKAPFDCNYCIMTEYLNPMLNRIQFWTRLERVLSRIGIAPYELQADLK